MEITDLNEIANDIAVSRLVQEGYEKELEALLQNIPEYQELQIKLTQAKATKGELNEKLLEAMREAQLKSWKTEQCSFSRAVRYSASIDPTYKARIEKKLKDGESVENWELKSTEYISIRPSKTK
jgi:hypothetical protein